MSFEFLFREIERGDKNSKRGGRNVKLPLLVTPIEDENKRKHVLDKSVITVLISWQEDLHPKLDHANQSLFESVSRKQQALQYILSSRMRKRAASAIFPWVFLPIILGRADPSTRPPLSARQRRVRLVSPSNIDQYGFYGKFIHHLPYYYLNEIYDDNTQSNLSHLPVSKSSRRHRRLLEGSPSGSSTSNTTSTSNDNNNTTIMLTIEGSESPLFVCPSCGLSLQEQQNTILTNLTESFSRVELFSKTQRLVNALFVRLTINNENISSSVTGSSSVFKFLRQIEGVQQVWPHESFQPHLYDAVEYMGGRDVFSKYCVTGKNVRIAVLDSGIDWTHESLGGPGTLEAYEAAVKSNGDQLLRSGIFPTDRVVDGYDFLGENFEVTQKSSEAQPDGNPMDGLPGHGTAVGDAILQVAPDAQLIALKVCVTGGNLCPDFAIAQALEYALDPNGDNATDDRVDIINLSLGLPFFSPYVDFISKMMEQAFHLGAVPIVAMGNSKNIPFVAGFASIAPNVISVGSTVNPRENNFDKNKGPYMADYSSRGPGFNDMIKPDLVAPSGLRLAAAGTGSGFYSKVTGTSFSAPLVAGAVALLKEKCGSICSPFSLKAILMNNANPNVRYTADSDQGSPVSLSGAGEMHLYKSLSASFWAYSLDDNQPSLSLGVIDAASTVVISRTIRVINLSPENHTLSFSSHFRDQAKAETQALNLQFLTSDVLPGNDKACNSSNYVDVEITFTVDAFKVPTNHMTSTGPNRSNSSATLDHHEFGGQIVLFSEETAQDISLPFMAILRRAANVTVDNPKLRFEGGTKNVDIGLANTGAGVAQIDSYQILSFGKDDDENPFGDPVEPVDLRMVGYRALVPEDDIEDCSYVFEFSFQTWERQKILRTSVFEVQVDVDGDNRVDYFLFNAGLLSRHSNSPAEIFVRDAKTLEVFCTGFHVDHRTHSSTTILRVCSEAFGINKPGEMALQVRTIAVTHEGVAEATDQSAHAAYVSFPLAGIQAPSYDLGPGERLESILVYGTGESVNGFPPLGLMLVTDSYRRPDSTGAAVRGAETLILLQDFVEEMFEVFEERTEDELHIPPTQDFGGPDCTWANGLCDLDLAGIISNAMEAGSATRDTTTSDTMLLFDFVEADEEEEAPSCPPVEIPRASVPTKAPSTKTPTEMPSAHSTAYESGTIIPTFLGEISPVALYPPFHNSSFDSANITNSTSDTSRPPNSTATDPLIQSYAPNDTIPPEMLQDVNATYSSPITDVYATNSTPIFSNASTPILASNVTIQTPLDSFESALRSRSSSSPSLSPSLHPTFIEPLGSDALANYHTRCIGLLLSGSLCLLLNF
jgi:subtilisin family serine protease